MPGDAEDRASYLRAIEHVFVALQGKGFMLPATDVQRLDDWRARGVPARVVEEALRVSVQRFKKTHPPGTPLPRSLAWFERAIEARIAVWRDRTMAWRPLAGAATDATPPALADGPRGRLAGVLERARDAAIDPRVRALLDRALEKAAEAEEGAADPWTLAAELDGAIADGALALLEPAERDALRRKAEEAVAAKASRAIRDDARRERVHVETARLARERFALPELLEVLLG